MKENIKLFLTAVLQVFFVSMNVTFISHGKYPQMAITGFLISFIWSFNIKKIAFGGFTQQVIYSTGACIGTVIGYAISHHL